MPYLNKITVMGNLGKDPDLRYLSDSTAAVSVPIAYSEKRTDKQTGEVKESTEWFSALFYGGAAEAIHRYMHKGDCIQVHGKLRTRQYVDQQNRPRTAVEILVSEFQMIYTKPKGPGSADVNDPDSIHQHL